MIADHTQLHVLIGTEYDVGPFARSLSSFQLPLCCFFCPFSLAFHISVALAFLSSSSVQYVFLPGPSHVSQCCYSSPNFFGGSFPVLGSPLLLCQLNLRVSAYFLADDCKKPTIFRPSLCLFCAFHTFSSF